MPLERPTYTINGMRLTREEFFNLGRERVAFWNNMATQINKLDEYFEDARDIAIEQQGLGNTAAAVKIRDGSIARLGIGIAKLEATMSDIPTVKDMRQATLTKIYNHQAGVMRGVVENDGTVLFANSGLPQWLFDIIDSNQDGRIGPSDVLAYWQSL